MDYTAKKELAKRVLTFLDGKGYVTSHRLYSAMGMTKMACLPLRKVLFRLQSVGVVSKIGSKSFRWKLERKDWDRENPFNKPIEEDMPVTTDIQGGFTAKFNGTCKRCGELIESGVSKLEKWHDGSGRPILTPQSKPIYVHKGCEKKEIGALNKAMQELAKPPVLDNGHISKEKFDDLLQDVKVLSSTIIKQAKRIEELEKARPPREVIITKPDKKKITLKEAVHPVFEEVLFQVRKCKFNVLLVGPRGSGKTMLAGHVAKALELDYGVASLSGGVTEGKLLGRVIPDINTGKSVFHPALFAQMFEQGGVFLLDEIDAADPNVLLTLNNALEKGELALERTKNPIAKRHEDFVCLAAANTFGTGADRQYVGRNQQDAAFLERFVTVQMDYDRELERQLCQPFNDMLDTFWKYRDNVVKNNLERTISTRFLCRAKVWLEKGRDLAYCEQQCFMGWRNDEITKAKGGY